MVYYLGIDGGGTNSRLMAVDQNDAILAETFGDSTNIASNSVETVEANLRFLFDSFLNDCQQTTNDCLALCIGSAGLDSDHSIHVMETIIRRYGFSCPILAVNDGLLALAAITKAKEGIIVISGTGSIACGISREGETIRCGGWGHLLDDVGSGYWIGKEAMISALRASDGRGEKTILTDMIKQDLNLLHISDCMDRVYHDLNKSDIAKYSVFVLNGARAGDVVCYTILERASDDLFDMADAILKKIQDDSIDVVVSGGTLMKNEILYGLFADKIHVHYPKIHVKKIHQKPVWGAIYLAKTLT